MRNALLFMMLGLLFCNKPRPPINPNDQGGVASLERKTPPASSAQNSPELAARSDSEHESQGSADRAAKQVATAGSGRQSVAAQREALGRRVEQTPTQVEQQAAQAEQAKAAATAADDRVTAEAARAAAAGQQQAAQAVASSSQPNARTAAESARADADRAVVSRQADSAHAQAEADKAELRSRLLDQLNAILETRDSARGLIVNISDVLFDSNQNTLNPGAREKLAKLSGILLAYPGLKLAIEGHTNNVGSDEYNQALSEKRAASVRDYFVAQGINNLTVTRTGKANPVESNDTAAGRQRNRRVEMVISGEAIGGPR